MVIHDHAADGLLALSTAKQSLEVCQARWNNGETLEITMALNTNHIWSSG